jgi:branched-chain amino acid transport system permease protein
VVQAFLSGIAFGLATAVLSVAFALVYLPTRVFYLTLGGLYAAAPYIFMAVRALGASPVVAAIPALLIPGIIAVLTEAFVHEPLDRRGASSHVHFVASLGCFLLVVQTVVLIWGPDNQFFGLPLRIELGRFWLTSAQIGIILSSAVTLIATLGWLSWTERGRELRALADNPALLELFGKDIRVIRRSAFFVAGTLAAVSGITTALDVGFGPHTGISAVLVATAATLVGGRGQIAWIAAAGLGLGLLREQVAWWTSAEWKEAVTFAVLASFLFFAPRGLYGIWGYALSRPEEQ